MLWQNEPTVVIGRNQNAYAELDLAYAEREGIHIARRITGGGAVYHDLGNLNYTYISAKGVEALDFATLAEPIISALSELGLNAKLSGRNDIEIDGVKISGNAQHSEGERVLQHGTLLFDTDLSVLSRVLLPDEAKLATKGIKSVRARVGNIKERLPELCDAAELADIIERYVIKNCGARRCELDYSPDIDKLRERNASHEWIFPDRDFLSGYTALKKERYPFGTVSVSLGMVGEKIQNAKISGDFFGKRDISELEAVLSGLSLSELGTALVSLPIGEYILGMTGNDLLSLILK
jgi:lipoate-protein ligase A